MMLIVSICRTGTRLCMMGDVDRSVNTVNNVFSVEFMGVRGRINLLLEVNNISIDEMDNDEPKIKIFVNLTEEDNLQGNEEIFS